MHRHGDTAMMGRTHATSGAAAFLALTPILSWAGVDATTPTITIGMVAAAGAAMLPDLDHPQATISRALGPITRLLSAATEAVSGGHRQATHSLLGVLAFTALTWVLTLAQDAELGRALLGVWLSLLFVSAATALQLPCPRLVRIAVGIGGAVLLVVASTQQAFALDVVVWAVAVGATAHVVGDLLTREGCPLLWPLSRRRHRLLSLTTHGPAERLLISPALALVAVCLLVRHAGGPFNLWAGLAELLIPDQPG